MEGASGVFTRGARQLQVASYPSKNEDTVLLIYTLPLQASPPCISVKQGVTLVEWISYILANR